ncbi:MAG: hypothetical protein LBB24_02650 [Rickettsiales bacterium]|nr:hypothetical protein [Rickettsiales bacterium]
MEKKKVLSLLAIILVSSPLCGPGSCVFANLRENGGDRFENDENREDNQDRENHWDREGYQRESSSGLNRIVDDSNSRALEPLASGDASGEQQTAGEPKSGDQTLDNPRAHYGPHAGHGWGRRRRCREYWRQRNSGLDRTDDDSNSRALEPLAGGNASGEQQTAGEPKSGDQTLDNKPGAHYGPHARRYRRWKRHWKQWNQETEGMNRTDDNSNSDVLDSPAGGDANGEQQTAGKPESGDQTLDNNSGAHYGPHARGYRRWKRHWEQYLKQWKQETEGMNRTDDDSHSDVLDSPAGDNAGGEQQTAGEPKSGDQTLDNNPGAHYGPHTGHGCGRHGGWKKYWKQYWDLMKEMEQEEKSKGIENGKEVKEL